MVHLFWQPTPVLVLSILQFHLKLLVRYGQIPITIMKFFSSSIMPTPFLLRLNIGWLGLFPPDSHLATPLHLTVMSHPGELLLLLYWAEKVLPDHLHLCQTLWQWQILGGRWKRLNWWKIQIPGRDFFFTWFGGDMGRNCLGAWASGEVASLQPVAKKRVWFIHSYVSFIKYLLAHPDGLHLERWRVRRRQRGRLRSWEELPACLKGFPKEGQRHQAFDLCLTQYPFTQFAAQYL